MNWNSLPGDKAAQMDMKKWACFLHGGEYSSGRTGLREGERTVHGVGVGVEASTNVTVGTLSLGRYTRMAF